jgi:simple sugar transport system permease protein
MRSVILSVTAVVLALLIGAVILALSGASPVDAYAALAQGAFGDAAAWQRTLEKATPLVFSGLAVAFAFKAGLFNIGAQGQLLLGAIIAAAVGFGVDGLPAWIHAPLALTAGAAAGAAFAAIAGALKVYTGAHEVITTIMLNYIAINLTDYLADGPWKDTSPGNIVARTPRILDTSMLPTWGPIPSGFVLSVLLAGLIYWLLWKTTFGFEIRTVGQNRHAARYAGIRVARTVILTMLISGLFAGLGGAVETQGVVGRYQPGFNVGLGFEGITIALLAKTHPFGVIPAALLVGAMKAGSSQMQFVADVPKEIIDVIQALILFFIAAEFLLRRLLRIKAEAGEEQLVLSTGWGSGE